MAGNDALTRGRDAYRRRAWSEAFGQLSLADQDSGLAAADLERLATAAYLTGRDVVGHRTRAYQELVRGGDVSGAVRCAFWLAFVLLNRGEVAHGGGWLTRGRRLLPPELDCVEQGYLLLPAARQLVLGGDFSEGGELAEQAASLGERFDDHDLVVLARHIQARALIRLGRISEGVALLDELMVAVTAGEVSEVVAGNTYCAVIEACQETFDLRRAREWTSALSRWCAAQPDLVPFSHQCEVHRSEILQLHGAWPEALAAAREAVRRFAAEPGHPAAGVAYYLLGDLSRLTGDLPAAEEQYRQANRLGRRPQPGLALLRLAHGQADTAALAIRAAIEDAPDPPNRCRLLPACVEIMTAAGDVPAARAAADELAQFASRLDAPVLWAAATHTRGAVLLAEGAARDAVGDLRDAWAAWQELEVPYEAARVRVLIGLACRALGDEDTARMELDAAGWVFEQLGAVTDLGRLALAPLARPGGLTARETQVLRMVAAGGTNRAIAGELFLSEKTVARHVSNIFAKLGVTSRSAATAWAYEQNVI
jgi:DNA-binding CsgD family transcriptional regulator